MIHRQNGEDSAESDHFTSGYPRMMLCEEEVLPSPIYCYGIPEIGHLPRIENSPTNQRRRARRYKSQLGLTLPKLVDALENSTDGSNSPREAKITPRSYEKMSYSVRLSSASRPGPCSTSHSLPPKYGLTPYYRKQENTSKTWPMNINQVNRTVQYATNKTGMSLIDGMPRLPSLSSQGYGNKDPLKQGFRVSLTSRGHLSQPTNSREDSLQQNSELLIGQQLLGNQCGPLIGRPGQRHLSPMGMVKKRTSTPPAQYDDKLSGDLIIDGSLVI